MSERSLTPDPSPIRERGTRYESAMRFAKAFEPLSHGERGWGEGRQR